MYFRGGQLRQAELGEHVCTDGRCQEGQLHCLMLYPVAIDLFYM